MEKENPLDVQIGGDHYKSLPYQPDTLATVLCFNFKQGSMLKYVSRYKKKDGRKDLLKVIHFAQLGQQMPPKNFYLFGEESSSEIHRYVTLNKMPPLIEQIIFEIASQNWIEIVKLINLLIKELDETEGNKV